MHPYFHKQGTILKGTLHGYEMYDLNAVKDSEWDEVSTYLHTLQSRHPDGYLVRNRAGFTSYRRIKQWSKALGSLSALHLYSTTTHDSQSGLGRILHWLNVEFSDRCMVRFLQDRYAQYQINIEKKGEITGLLCPASVGKTKTCVTCGQCWSTEEPITLCG
jgi:hypothetical protein